MNKKCTLIVAAVIASVVVAQASPPSTVSFTDSVSGTQAWTQMLGIQQFDTTLGTLTGISLTFTGESSYAGTVNNTSAGAYDSGSFISVTTTFGFAGAGTLDTYLKGGSLFGTKVVGSKLESDTDLSGLASGSGLTIFDADTLTSANTTKAIGSSYWSYFEGAGLTDINITAPSALLLSLSPNGANFTDSLTGTATITANITYTYTPAPAPEPSVAIMVGGGLAGLMLIWRRRAGK